MVSGLALKSIFLSTTAKDPFLLVTCEETERDIGFFPFVATEWALSVHSASPNSVVPLVPLLVPVSFHCRPPL